MTLDLLALRALILWPTPMEIRTMRIEPRFFPRDLIDVLVGLPIAVLQVVLVMGVPTLIVTLSVSKEAGAITFLLIALLYLISCLFVVRSLEIEPDHILFRRVLGNRNRLAKSEIVSVEEAPRGEVVIHGWLWPPFPFSREMTTCLSAKHHFRIRWKDGFCYFPPREVEQFRCAISEMMSERQPSSSSDG